MKNERWNNFINVHSSEQAETKRKKLVVLFFSYIGGTILLLFALQTPYDSNGLLKVALFIFSFSFYINIIALHFHHNNALAFNLCGLTVIPTVITVIATGGYENTGLYWAYPFPIALFILFGYFRGLIINALLFSCIIFILFSPEYVPAVYRKEEVSRFIITYLVNIILCLIAEYFRFQSYVELSNINIEKQQLANTDPLTKLTNRRFLHTVFKEIARQSPHDYYPLSAFQVDVDHFKLINDNYGHDVGDKMLKHISSCFKNCTREGDILCRTGGEEFLIIIPKSSPTDAQVIAEKIRSFIEHHPLNIEEKLISITISIGLVSVLTPDELEEQLVIADKLLYQAKNNGRNRIEFTLN